MPKSCRPLPIFARQRVVCSTHAALDNHGISARADYLSKQTQCKLTGADSLALNCIQNKEITAVMAVRSQYMGSTDGAKYHFNQIITLYYLNMYIYIISYFVKMLYLKYKF